jgi:ATP-dependent RNA helicase DeaD
VAITLVDPRERRVLRVIEALTKQPIEIVALPTAAALRARRLDITRAALRERLVAGGLGDMRAVVESLAHDFELMDIAAAAVAMMHEEAEAASALAADVDVPDAVEADVSGPMTVLYIGAGREAGIRPGDIVGAITGEAKMTNRQVGGIRVGRNHTLVEVPEALADRVIAALRRTNLRGRKVDVKRAAR